MAEVRANTDGHTTQPLALWSAPRSRSTVFFRMMVERGEFTLAHEPFSELAAGRAARVADQELSDPATVIDYMLREARPVFFKETTEYSHASLFQAHPSIHAMTHTFIVRDPRRVINSHFAMNPEVTRDEIGFENLYEIFRIVQDQSGTIPVVIDADALVRDPAAVVSAYCERVGLAARPTSLTWSPGARNEWASTSKWHEDVASSDTFRSDEREHAVTTDNDARLAEYLAYHLPFYQRLLDFSITTASRLP